MTHTIEMEKLSAENQHTFEESFASGAPILLSRDGQPFGSMVPYEAAIQAFEPETPEEIAEIQEAVQQGREDYAAGRVKTLDEIKARYAARQQETRP